MITKAKQFNNDGSLRNSLPIRRPVAEVVARILSCGNPWISACRLVLDSVDLDESVDTHYNIFATQQNRKHFCQILSVPSQKGCNDHLISWHRMNTWVKFLSLGSRWNVERLVWIWVWGGRRWWYWDCGKNLEKGVQEKYSLKTADLHGTWL